MRKKKIALLLAANMFFTALFSGCNKERIRNEDPVDLSYDVGVIETNEEREFEEDKELESSEGETFFEEPVNTLEEENTNTEENIEEDEIIELSLVDKILLDDNYLGDRGRLYFSNFNSVGLYSVDLYDEAGTQAIVDNKDSAAIFNLGNCIVIADHKNQGFNVLKNITVGESVYIKHEEDQIESYKCLEIINGTNTGYDLITEDGRNIKEFAEGTIVMYTCRDNWQNVIITVWTKASELNKVLVKE